MFGQRCPKNLIADEVIECLPQCATARLAQSGLTKRSAPFVRFLGRGRRINIMGRSVRHKKLLQCDDSLLLHLT
jgi:hypothetical protein